MDDQIIIGTSILDSVNELSKIVQLVTEVSVEYKQSAMNFCTAYKGGANENNEYLQTNLMNNIELLNVYYNIAIQSMVYALEEFIGKDEALATAVVEKFEEMIK